MERKRERAYGPPGPKIQVHHTGQVSNQGAPKAGQGAALPYNLPNQVMEPVGPIFDGWAYALTWSRVDPRNYQNWVRGRGGGLSGTEWGRTYVKYFTEEGVFFKNSACPRFVKEGSFFEPRYKVWGTKIPLQSTKYAWLWRQLTSKVTGLLSLLPLSRQRIIKSKVKICVHVHPMSVFW